jgi:molybdopterin converting factor subunit 1
VTLTVLLFASYADAIGRTEVDLSLPPGATVRELVARLGALPGGERLPPAPLVAVNHRYARGDQVLRAGDEVAVIPPVAGG